jgi:hypothetical protein
LLAQPDLNPRIREQIERQLEVRPPGTLKQVASEAVSSGKSRIKVSAAIQRTAEDGTVFDSKWELSVYEWLRRVIPAAHLQRQPVFLLQAACQDDRGAKIRPVRYTADFLLSREPRTDEAAPLHAEDVVVDAKGWRTEIFILKAKWFVGTFGKAVRLVRQGHTEDMEKLLEEYVSKFNR